MNQLVPFRFADGAPALITAAADQARVRLHRILHGPISAIRTRAAPSKSRPRSGRLPSVLQDIVRQIKSRGASLKATEQPIDTRTAAGKCFLDMLGVSAEFETNLRRERQLEGIAKAKAAGVYKGRPASIDAPRVRELKAQGVGATEIAKTLGIGRASVYRVLEGDR
jgi:DNA invertase Pin-like site-specific DNA recombinase